MIVSKIVEKFKQILGQASPNIFEEKINKKLIDRKIDKKKPRKKDGNKNNKNK